MEVGFRRGQLAGITNGHKETLWVMNLFTIFHSNVCRGATFMLKLNKLHTSNMGSLSIILQFLKKLGVIMKRSQYERHCGSQSSIMNTPTDRTILLKMCSGCTLQRLPGQFGAQREHSLPGFVNFSLYSLRSHSFEVLWAFPLL